MLSQRIAQARTRLGMTQRDLASKLNIAQSSVALWETGKNVPSGKNLIKLSQLLGVAVEDLTDGTPVEDLPEGAYLPRFKSVLMPYRGRIHAGDPIEVDEVVELREIPEHVGKAHPRGFLLDVVGDCMNNMYPDGCVVLVDPALEPRTGDTGAFLVDTEVVMRRVLRGAHMLVLSPDSTNDEHKDIVITGEHEVTTYGKIVWFQAAREL